MSYDAWQKKGNNKKDTKVERKNGWMERERGRKSWGAREVEMLSRKHAHIITRYIEDRTELLKIKTSF